MAVDITWPGDGLTPWGSPLRNGLDELQDAINSNESRIEPLEGVPNEIDALQLSVGLLQSKTNIQSGSWPTTGSETGGVATELLHHPTPGAWSFKDLDGSYGTPAIGSGSILILPVQPNASSPNQRPVAQILSYTSGIAAGNTYTRYFDGTEWSDWVQIGPEGPKGDKGDKGDPGEDGTGISISGSVADYASLPTTLTGDDAGQSYFVETDGLLYIWDGSQFPEDGDGITFRGPKGDKGDQGDPGPGVEGLTTRVTDLETWKGSLNLANVLDFGAVGDGVANDSPAFNSAIASLSEGGTLLIPAGRTYRLGGVLSFDAGISVIATGATLIFSGQGSSRITVAGGYDGVTSVTTVEELVSTTAPSGSPERLVRVQTTGVFPLDWRKGDTLRLVSDDIIPFSRDSNDDPATTPGQGRSGDFFQFHSYESETSILLSGSLEFPFTSNMRIGRVEDRGAFIWEGGTFDYTDESWQGSASWAFDIGPRIGTRFLGVRFRRVHRGALRLSENQNWGVVSCRFEEGVNDLSRIAYSYGIANYASVDGVVESCFFGSVRHGYTDGYSYGTVAGLTGTVQGYGCAHDVTVSDSISDGGTGGGFSTHTAAYRIRFENCHARNQDVGFGIRGHDNFVLNCSTSNVTTGVRVFDENSGGDAWGIIVDGLSCWGAETAVNIDLRDEASNPNYFIRETRPITVRNVNSFGNRGNWMSVEHATVNVENAYIQHAEGSTAGGLRNVQSVVRVRNLTHDLSLSPNTIITAVAAFSGSAYSQGPTFEFDGVRLLNNYNTGRPDGANIRRFVFGGASVCKFRASNVVLDAPFIDYARQYNYATSGSLSDLSTVGS